MNKVKLILPFIPCSVNEAFSWYPKRHKSNVYKEFEYKMEKYFLELWKKYEITDNNWLQFNYTLYMPLYYKNWNKKKQDIANYEKCLVDCLSHHIKGFKDENIKIMLSRKVDSDKLETEIEIFELL